MGGLGSLNANKEQPQAAIMHLHNSVDKFKTLETLQTCNTGKNLQGKI